MIYTDHEVNSVIAAETKFNTTNIDKLNLKFIKASIYLFQFRFEVRHRSEKFNIVSDALSKLSIIKHKNNLDIDAEDSKSDHVYAFVNT